MQTMPHTFHAGSIIFSVYEFLPKIFLKSSLSMGTGAADTRKGRLKPISAASVNSSFQ